MPHRRSILLYEYATGGGLGAGDFSTRRRLLDEGLAMLHALAEDFATIEDMHVKVVADSRIKVDWPASCEIIHPAWNDDGVRSIAELSTTVDWTVLIAPETGGELQRRAEAILAAGGRLLGPDPALIALAADKHALCEVLAAQEVRVPAGKIHWEDEDLPREVRFPAVVKPLDSCGAEQVRLIHDDFSLARYTRQVPNYRLEQHCPGVAASVAVLGGTAQTVILPACGQTIEHDHDPDRASLGDAFIYRGGFLPLAPALEARADELTAAVAQALPDWIGYLGIDIVLGPAEDGSEDYVIEVNPRLTTSYVGLRVAAHDNLARAMLDLADGVEPQLEFSDARVRFTAAGEIECDEASSQSEAPP